jgi:hypothetical protein
MTHENAEQNTTENPNPSEIDGKEQEEQNTLEPIADILARTKEAAAKEENLKEEPQKTLKKTAKEEPPKTEDAKGSETKSPAIQKGDTASSETDDKETSPSHWQDASVKEAEKAERRLADSQKWGREAHSKLKSVEHLIGQYLGKGILSDEEAALLLASSQHPDPFAEQKEEPLLMRYGTIWDRELAHMRKYTDSPDLDQHIQAFQHFLKNGSPAEVTEAFMELKALEKDDVAFTRKMLELGKAYHDEVYKEIHEAGSLKSYKIKMKQEIEKHLRKIDKLEKEIVKYKEQYEDYTPSKSYRLPSGGSAESPKDSDSSIGSILDRAKMGTLRR